MAWSIVGIALLCLIISVSVAVFIVNKLTKPLEQIRGLMKKAREGDLDISFDGIRHTTPEVKSLIESFQAVLVSMQGILQNIGIDSRTVTCNWPTTATVIHACFRNESRVIDWH